MSSFPLVFHAAGQRMRLSLRCLRLHLDGWLCPSRFPRATAVTLEVFFQPRCRDRLPQGLPVLLCREQLPLQSSSEDQPRWEYALPAHISPEQAARCHYRISAAAGGE